MISHVRQLGAKRLVYNREEYKVLQMGSVLFILMGKETWSPYKIEQLLWFREAERMGAKVNQIHEQLNRGKTGNVHVLIT
jgi:hypothetical protein